MRLAFNLSKVVVMPHVQRMAWLRWLGAWAARWAERDHRIGMAAALAHVPERDLDDVDLPPDIRNLIASRRREHHRF